jgi:predicted secreted protein
MMAAAAAAVAVAAASAAEARRKQQQRQQQQRQQVWRSLDLFWLLASHSNTQITTLFNPAQDCQMDIYILFDTMHCLTTGF